MLYSISRFVFDFLRENDVYDNTRIILVSDHGYSLDQFEELVLNTGKNKTENIEWYYPLLLVKDFGSKEFSVSVIYACFYKFCQNIVAI